MTELSRRARRALVPLAWSLALAGCVNLPQTRQADPVLPAAWPTGVDAQATQAAPAPDWWKAFADPTLDALIQEALAHNSDLLLAAARIEEARANLGQARSNQYPSAQVGASAGRSRATEKGSFPIPSPVNNNYQVNLQAAFEVDLWGRYRQATEAARAQLLASRHAREVVRLSLTAQVAQGYFALRALDRQLALADETLANRQAAVDLHKLRFESGLTSELSLRQAEAEWAAIQSTRAGLAGQLRQQELALALLLGREAKGIVEQGIARGTALADLPLPPAIPAGLPADLLQRRPDLRQAEQNLVAAQARIAEARAAIYPNLSLTANLGSESRALSDLFSGPATVWGLTAGLMQTVFNAGRTEAVVSARVAQQEQTLLAYEQTVRQAFKEVLDALVAQRQAGEVATAEARRADALSRAAELADLRYRNGVSSYLDVLDAQRNLYQASQAAIDARRAQLAAVVALNTALGGGWQGLPAEEARLAAAAP